jgi:predicted nucleotidyltransferase
MIPAVDAHRAGIAALCRQFGVRRLDLFGSAARGTDFTARSDVDFLVEFDAGRSPVTLADFFGFRDALAALLGRQIDLTMAGAIRNPFLRAAIERSRVPVHGA